MDETLAARRRAAAAETVARKLLHPFWREADQRHAGVELHDAASVARWQELHARDREERLYFIVKKAVFWGVFAAQLALAILGVALGVAMLAWRPWA